MNEPKEHDLTRFLDAQAGDFDVALQELVKRSKRSHWIVVYLPPGCRPWPQLDVREIRDPVHTLGSRICERCDFLRTLHGKAELEA
jgi:uncharacterized protein (DUF1810 family)